MNCRSGYVVCSDEAKCIEEKKVCDGIVDCRYASDERNCRTNITGKYTPFTYGTGRYTHITNSIIKCTSTANSTGKYTPTNSTRKEGL